MQLKSLFKISSQPAKPLRDRDAAARGLTRRPVWRCAAHDHLAITQGLGELR